MGGALAALLVVVLHIFVGSFAFPAAVMAPITAWSIARVRIGDGGECAVAAVVALPACFVLLIPVGLVFGYFVMPIVGLVLLLFGVDIGPLA